MDQLKAYYYYYELLAILVTFYFFSAGLIAILHPLPSNLGFGDLIVIIAQLACVELLTAVSRFNC